MKVKFLSFKKEMRKLKVKGIGTEYSFKECGNQRNRNEKIKSKGSGA